MKRILYILLSLFVIFNITSCKSCNNKKPEKPIEDQAFNETEFFEKIDQSKIESINQIVEGFSTPIEMAAMIEDQHIPFSKKYIANTEIVDYYDTNIKKALGLGILSADLGYLNVYHKTSMMVDYLVAIRKLSEDLNVSQFFDFQTLKYLVLHSDNIDTLIFMSVSSFHRIDDYFRQTNRSYLSVLSVTGVWIESLFLITQVAKDNPQIDLTDKIGSQKVLFTQLFEILKVYKGHPFFDYIINEFEKLKIAFDPVEITEVQGQKHIEEIDGNITIYQDTETKITMPPGTLENIIKTTQHVRNNLINLTK